MAFIKWIEDEQASGELAALIGKWKEANPHRKRFPDIMKCFTLRPDFLRTVMDFSYSLHFNDGFLTRRTKEMIATYVSGLNRCPY
jgi:alkylhydroperoxidase family enzyme